MRCGSVTSLHMHTPVGMLASFLAKVCIYERGLQAAGCIHIRLVQTQDTCNQQTHTGKRSATYRHVCNNIIYLAEFGPPLEGPGGNGTCSSTF